MVAARSSKEVCLNHIAQRGFLRGCLLSPGTKPPNLYKNNVFSRWFFLWGFGLGQMERIRNEAKWDRETQEETLAKSPLWGIVKDWRDKHE